ncbi:MAG: hypothetical protein ABGY95_00305 [Rubritalea sp.]|uniref:hypothetical protein n=1 Tax=Rubritalea sp. TaxID=2109375 RepID=UPI0032426E87
MKHISQLISQTPPPGYKAPTQEEIFQDNFINQIAAIVGYGTVKAVQTFDHDDGTKTVIRFSHHELSAYNEAVLHFSWTKNSGPDLEKSPQDQGDISLKISSLEDTLYLHLNQQATIFTKCEIGAHNQVSQFPPGIIPELDQYQLEDPRVLLFHILHHHISAQTMSSSLI